MPTENPQLPAYRRLVRSLISGLGSRFPVSPKNVQEGVAVCRQLRTHRVATTLAQFGEGGDDPVDVVERYRTASTLLRNPTDDGSFYLSVKPPDLYFELAHAEAVASTAIRNNHRVHFDSHGHEIADATIELLSSLMDSSPAPTPGTWRFGLTLPSRWKRSIADAAWVAEKGVRPRLVKGEFTASAPSDEVDARRGFLDLVDYLAGKVPEIAIATHDYVLARESISRCRGSGSTVELELLFGIPAGNLIALARTLAVPVRFYVPYGDTLTQYGISHMLAHPYKLLRPHSLELLSSADSKLAAIVKTVSPVSDRSSVSDVPRLS